MRQPHVHPVLVVALVDVAHLLGVLLRVLLLPDFLLLLRPEHVRVLLPSQLPVGLADLILAAVPVDPQDLITILVPTVDVHHVLLVLLRRGDGHHHHRDQAAEPAYG
jgi:hypothetical protein